MFFAFPHLPREHRYNFPNPPKISTDFTAKHPEGLKDADTRLERLPFEGWGAMRSFLTLVFESQLFPFPCWPGDGKSVQRD